MQRLIAVLRRPQVIVALISERARPFSAEQAGRDPYREQVVALTAVSEAVCPWRDKDVRAWRALSSVPRLNERAALAIIRSVIGSVVDPDAAVPPLPPLRFGGASVDVRPYLCSADGEDELLTGLHEVLDSVTDEVEFPAWHWHRRHDIAALPAGFRRGFLWGLHLSPWEQVEATLAAYQQLELDAHPDLRRALARLLSLARRPLGLWWCDLLVEVPAAQQLRAAEIILESRAYEQAPDDEARRALLATPG
jgi:hypothetical protein